MASESEELKYPCITVDKSKYLRTKKLVAYAMTLIWAKQISAERKLSSEPLIKFADTFLRKYASCMKFKLDGGTNNDPLNQMFNMLMKGSKIRDDYVERIISMSNATLKCYKEGKADGGLLISVNVESVRKSTGNQEMFDNRNRANLMMFYDECLKMTFENKIYSKHLLSHVNKSLSSSWKAGDNEYTELIKPVVCFGAFMMIVMTKGIEQSNNKMTLEYKDSFHQFINSLYDCKPRVTVIDNYGCPISEAVLKSLGFNPLFDQESSMQNQCRYSSSREDVFILVCDSILELDSESLSLIESASRLIINAFVCESMSKDEVLHQIHEYNCKSLDPIFGIPAGSNYSGILKARFFDANGPVVTRAS